MKRVSGAKNFFFRCYNFWTAAMDIGDSARSSERITALLQAWSLGDADALEQLTPLVYRRLHSIARHYMRQEADGHTLQTTALINETYLRLIDARKANWQNRAHFFAVCSQVMRRILTDHARARLSHKRGAETVRLSLDEAPALCAQLHPDLVALDDALTRLAVFDPRKCRVVELRFFGGATVEESAAALGVSPDTIKRDWRLARTWLLRELSATPSYDA